MTEGAASGARVDRRSRRRQETLEEILDISVDLMTEAGVNGLTLSEVARRLGIQPPSLYKYFDSLNAIFDALFARGQRRHFEAIANAMEVAPPGLAGLRAGLEASTRWGLENPALAQLLFWRPVPKFEPSPEAMAPSNEMVGLFRRALAEAVTQHELGSAADSDDALFAISILVSGTVGQSIANEPNVTWEEGRYTRLLSKLLDALPAMYPPPATQGSGNRVRPKTSDRRAGGA